MKDKCQCCDNHKGEILMTKTLNNVTYPKYYCSECVSSAIRTINPKTFPDGIRPDVRVLRDILNADKMVSNRCWDIFNETKTGIKTVKKTTPKKKKQTVDNCSPATIYKKLDERIIGQEEAKRKMSLAIRRKAMSEANPLISKINLMLIGPTASGKTELARVASEITACPFVKIDCSHLTPSGYKGVNVDSILLRLFEAANGDTEKAQNGIVLLDEFDKIIRNGEFSSRIQQELLKLIEGDVFPFEIDKHKPLQRMDTTGILFIAAGSFPGIEAIVSPKKTNISLASPRVEIVQDPASSNNVEAKHLIKFGLIPEIVGRFTHTATLKKLGSNEMFEILCRKKGNVAEEYTEIFKEMGQDISFSEDFLREIAYKAGQSETGARNLKFLMEEALGDYLFSEKGLPEKFLAKSDIKLSA